MKKSIGFIGSGRITKIFLQAFSNKKRDLNKVSIYDINQETCKLLKQGFPEIEIADLKSTASQELVFIALHPPVIMEVLEQIKAYVQAGTQIISLAPKITVKKIKDKLPTPQVARLIPNATSAINQGYNPVYFSENFEGKAETMELLKDLGNTFETQETKLEAYALTSAMLPTYFWFQWYEMISIGEKLGLTPEESKDTIEQSLMAAINTMAHKNMSKPEVLDLIPVKPIGEAEPMITNVLQTKLIDLFNKIKP